MGLTCSLGPWGAESEKPVELKKEELSSDEEEKNGGMLAVGEGIVYGKAEKRLLIQIPILACSSTSKLFDGLNRE